MIVILSPVSHWLLMLFRLYGVAAVDIPVNALLDGMIYKWQLLQFIVVPSPTYMVGLGRTTTASVEALHELQSPLSRTFIISDDGQAIVHPLLYPIEYVEDSKMFY